MAGPLMTATIVGYLELHGMDDVHPTHENPDEYRFYYKGSQYEKVLTNVLDCNVVIDTIKTFHES